MGACMDMGKRGCDGMLQINHLYKSYGKFQAVSNLTLHIPKGDLFGFVGPNGAGKTTLIKLICGLYTPTKGEILVGGRRIQEYNIEEYYSLISAVFQEIRAVAFTVFEFVASAGMDRPDARIHQSPAFLLPVL